MSNEPVRVIELSPAELKAKLDSGEVTEFYDVRTEKERQVCTIEGAKIYDQAAQDHIATLDKETPIALHCHHGMRSRNAGVRLLSKGHRVVYNLVGGIDKWSLEIDSSVPRY